MSLQQRRIGWLVGLVIALALTGWTVWTTTRDVRGPQVADLTRVPGGEWRSVNVGSSEKPVWADYRVVEIQRHPTLQPVAPASTRSSSKDTKPAVRTAPEGGTFAVVVSECRCPVDEDLRAPTIRLVDSDGREWTTGNVRPGQAEEYGDAARSTSIGDDEEGRVGDVQRLVELFEVAKDPRDLDAVVGRVKLPSEGSSADGTGHAVWATRD